MPARAAARALRRPQAIYGVSLPLVLLPLVILCTCTMVGLDVRDALYMVYCMADHMSATPLLTSICLPACARDLFQGCANPHLDFSYTAPQGT